MKLLIDRKHLLESCLLLQTAAASRTTKPIYRCIKFVAGDRLQGQATDLECGIVHDIDAMINEPGEAVVPADILVGMLQASSAVEAWLSTDGGQVRVELGSSVYNLATEDPRTFNDLTMRRNGPEFAVPADQMKRAVRRTVFAASENETVRHGENGCHISVANGIATLACMDSKMAAFTEVPCEGEGEAAGILTIKSLKLLEKAVGSMPDDGVISLTITSASAFLGCGRSLIAARLVAGNFPPYRKLFGHQADQTVRFRAGDLLKTVKAAAVVGSEESRRAKFQFVPGKLVVSVSGRGRGTAQMELPEFGGRFHFHADPEPLTAMLRALPADGEVKMEFRVEDKPVVLSHDTSHYAVVPMVTV